jgi:hypothetical protein
LQTRNSHGLEQFCATLEDRQGMSILDLSGANQDTISFITGYGHRLYSDDFLMQMDRCFGDGDFYANQADPANISKFLEDALLFPDENFDGVLVWDRLQFLSAPLLEAVMGRLQSIMNPGGTLLAIFTADERAQSIPTYSFRIADRRTMSLIPKGQRQPAQVFNNRSLERLFQNFQSVKFFLTRDHLREVIVRR